MPEPSYNSRPNFPSPHAHNSQQNNTYNNQSNLNNQVFGRPSNVRNHFESSNKMMDALGGGAFNNQKRELSKKANQSRGMQRSPSPFAVDDKYDAFKTQKRDIMGNTRKADPLASPRGNSRGNNNMGRSQYQQRSAFDQMNNQINSQVNNQYPDNSRRMENHGANNQYNDNGIESIASKRMAVRRGRGNLYYVCNL